MPGSELIILTVVSILSCLFPLVLAYSRRPLGKSFQLVVLVVFLTFAFQITMLFPSIHLTYVMPATNTYFFLQGMCFLLLYRHHIPLVKRMFPFLTLLFLVSYLGAFLLGYTAFGLNSAIMVVTCFTMIGLAFLYFFHQLAEKPDQADWNQAMLWVNIGVLIYYGGMLLPSLFVFTLHSHHAFLFHHFMTIACNTLFTLALWRHRTLAI